MQQARARQPDQAMTTLLQVEMSRWKNIGLCWCAKLMKCYDLVSPHAVNLFLEPLRSVRICDDSVRIRTDTTLDQDCVLKATVQVCTACMIVSLLTTCLNLKTPPLAQVAPFRCKIRESNVEVPLDTKLSKHVCQLIMVCTTLRFQAWCTAS